MVNVNKYFVHPIHVVVPNKVKFQLLNKFFLSVNITYKHQLVLSLPINNFIFNTESIPIISIVYGNTKACGHFFLVNSSIERCSIVFVVVVTTVHTLYICFPTFCTGVFHQCSSHNCLTTIRYKRTQMNFTYKNTNSSGVRWRILIVNSLVIGQIPIYSIVVFHYW